ncbi:cell redox homeostasis [Desmophyllum pertusum]|uniref:Cell redox homeostasis n=1 Tax=Desmophyllum pertusum TaxID=174260 RepID=A0A9X0DA68_9CNID|nr:cell redox homeostasis [Desmophyllum pertusum]
MAYVKTSIHKKRFEGETFPVIHLHLSKSSENFLQYTSKLEYEELMDFISSHTKIKRPVSLPPSLSDVAPISFPHSNEEKDDSEEFLEELEEERESLDSNEETEEDSGILPDEETEDDEVSATVLKAKPAVVAESLVPTLTDKTFDVIKKENDVLVVDFYQPWDARCKAFLQPYVDAAAHLSNLDVGEFSIKLARVNCFDWTDVCQRNNITVYPTIKMFRKGSDEVIYKGPLDSDHLAKAVLLLQPTVPLALNSKDEVDMFFDGKLPKLAKTATNIAVIGMFLDKNDKEFEAFGSAAQSLYSKFLLGYVTGETARTLSAEYGLKLPSLLVFKRNDPYQPMDVFENHFTSQSVVDFVLRSNIPSFGELTPFNLPMYLTHKKPLVIVFRADNEDSVITPVMTKLARDKSLPSVFLCWMPVYSNNDVNAEILKTYTGSSEALPTLVLVNHDKGTVYHFKEDITKPAVKSWVENILTGKEQPTGLFADGEWKPRLEGYDFLRMIDEEEEEKERTRLKKQKLEQALNEDLDEESEWSSSEADKTEEKKSSRLRRPEVKSSRDEL